MTCPTWPEENNVPKDMFKQVRNCLAKQSVIKIPHKLSENVSVESDSKYADAVVVRIEPDGIHVRITGGLLKIDFEDMSESWREAYCIDLKTASFYREKNQKKSAVASEEARRLNAERAARINAGIEARREKEEAQKEYDDEQKEKMRKADAWRKYDENMRKYNREYDLAEKKWIDGRGFKMPVEPAPPAFPRPEE